MVGRFCIMMMAVPTPLVAQSTPPAPPPEIRVSGVGTVETAPDLAILDLSLRGEGPTPDDANRQLAARQQALVAGLRSIDPALDLRTETVRLNEIRTGDCGDDDDVSMSTVADSLDGNDTKGPCRVTGYRTSVEGEVRTTRVADAGTMVGLAGRLGATGVRISEFALRDPMAAMRRATAAAMDDARARAQLIAEAGKARLGPIRAVSDPEARDGLAVDELVARRYYMAAPAVTPPPVAIAVSPGPVRTEARLVVSFALLP